MSVHIVSMQVPRKTVSPVTSGLKCLVVIQLYGVNTANVREYEMKQYLETIIKHIEVDQVTKQLPYLASMLTVKLASFTEKND